LRPANIFRAFSSPCPTDTGDPGDPRYSCSSGCSGSTGASGNTGALGNSSR
jgi:hypothetical protein